MIINKLKSAIVMIKMGPNIKRYLVNFQILGISIKETSLIEVTQLLDHINI